MNRDLSDHNLSIRAIRCLYLAQVFRERGSPSVADRWETHARSWAEKMKRRSLSLGEACERRRLASGP